MTQGPQPIATTCPWDCEAIPDGAVGITDFLTLLANWRVAPVRGAVSVKPTTRTEPDV